MLEELEVGWQFVVWEAWENRGVTTLTDDMISEIAAAIALGYHGVEMHGISLVRAVK